MKAPAPNSLEAIPECLIKWIESQPPLPESMVGAITIYEAARAARAIPWRRKLDQFAALNTWTTLALIADERTRKYMARVIRNESDELYWPIRSGSAVRVVLEDLGDFPASSSTTRVFRQRREAALKGLRAARDSLAALNQDFSLRELLEGTDARNFLKVVGRFVFSNQKRRMRAALHARVQSIASGATASEGMAASFAAMLKANDSKVPYLSDLLQSAEGLIAGLEEPAVERYRSRSKYIRVMFRELEHTEIAAHRVAFLAHASKAVFGEEIEKREVRRLVADLASDEKSWNQMAAEMQAMSDREGGGKDG